MCHRLTGLQLKSNREDQENCRLLVGSDTAERHIPGCPRATRLQGKAGVYNNFQPELSG